MNLFLLMMAFFVMKFGQFLISPFLVLYLNSFSISPLCIGLIIGTGPIGYCLTSLFSIYLSDRYAPQYLFSLSLFGVGLAFMLLYERPFLTSYIVFPGLTGVFRAFFDSSSKILIATQIEETQKAFAFGLRYAVMNAAAALGPLVGVHYALKESSLLFKFLAWSFFLLICLLLLGSSKSKATPTHSDPSSSFRNRWQMIKSQAALRKLFLIHFICYGLYAQVTSTLAQYLIQQFHEGTTIYSSLLLCNALTCMTVPLLIKPLFKRLHYKTLAFLGLSFLALGFLGFCFAPNRLALNCCMLLLSLGEVIFFPLNDVLLTQIVTPQILGSCYGILNVATLGLALGPILGSALAEWGSYPALFLLCSVCSFLTISLYKSLLYAIPQE